MAQIRLEGLTFHAFHGVLPEEGQLGQNFIIDVEMSVNIEKAVDTDDYTQTVCYAAVTEVVAGVVTGPPFQLIETLADRIAHSLIDRFKLLDRVEVRVSKPDAPIPAAFDNVSVQVIHRRWRSLALSLGSNLGARDLILKEAISRLKLRKGFKITSVSPFYESRAWGETDQPAFINACLTAESYLPPHDILRVLKDIEQELGRAPERRWGPRLVDLDLLFVDDISVADDLLNLPHPHIAQRAFVLVPLADIAPDVEISGKSVRQLLNELPRQADDVRLYPSDQG